MLDWTKLLSCGRNIVGPTILFSIILEILYSNDEATKLIMTVGNRENLYWWNNVTMFTISMTCLFQLVLKQIVRAMTTEQCSNNIVIMAEQHYHWQRCSRWPSQSCSCWTRQTLFMLDTSNVVHACQLNVVHADKLNVVHDGQLNLVYAGHLNVDHAGQLNVIMLASSTFFKSVNMSLPWMMCVFACVHEKYNFLYTHTQEILRLDANGDIST